ncbi:MAG: hypothetical protein N2506_04255 [Dehalococcoidales bacterium]|nr:hypothetical protein [Dehalococcoidales bacterium]
MWRFKACRKCGGDVFIAADEYGWYEQCLQCGLRTELPNITELRNKSALPRGQREPVPARTR